MDYVEDQGIWHIVDREQDRDVVTLCERTLADVRPYRPDIEPKPLCSRCRERRKGA